MTVNSQITNENLRTNDFFVKKGSFRKKTNDGRTKWIVQRNEKMIVFLKQTKINKNERFKSFWTILIVHERFCLFFLQNERTLQIF